MSQHSSPLSVPEYVDYRAQSTALEDVAAYRRGRLTVTETGQDPERIAVAVVTANLFALFRAEPILGRTFNDAVQRRARLVLPSAGDGSSVS